MFTENVPVKEDPRIDWIGGAREMMYVNDMLHFLQNYNFLIRTSFEMKNSVDNYDCDIVEVGYKTEADAKKFYLKSKMVKNNMLAFNEGIVSCKFRSVRCGKSVLFVCTVQFFAPGEKVKHLFEVIEDWKPSKE